MLLYYNTKTDPPYPYILVIKKNTYIFKITNKHILKTFKTLYEKYFIYPYGIKWKKWM